MTGLLFRDPLRIAGKHERARLRWQRLNGSLPSHGLVPMRVQCINCGSTHTIALPGDAGLRDLLATMPCPSCFEVGSMKKEGLN